MKIHMDNILVQLLKKEQVCDKEVETNISLTFKLGLGFVLLTLLYFEKHVI